MAELNTGGKQTPRVDLTPMVDLAFLLITFFMLTTSLAKPHAMDVAMPDKDKENKDDNLEVADNRSMTILLGAKDKIEYYMGQLEKPLDGPTVVDYGKNGIRPVLLKKMKDVQAATGKPLIVIIRPSDNSNYRNLVDILDEMKIVNAQQYMIGDISTPEVELLKREGIY
ncbi:MULTISPECIES: ExbD/TolR family protein [Olivibacter]|jgi:biopolymer transport protein ExbD|uniref:Biopolymer transport protein ExbD/TolR n=2 Tax=Sphingobacteriaceae TaxID=84566 RepID=F4C544_SPHS2|nr:MULTISPECIES: biopolymer transporter ExbD [Olivibacter]MCL4638870.1 biopolymer transporter ExbD [Olivibacter sp. UJ_SKK_5.1]MDM8176943.1 biopolymer transporter ExbD [Olivibacter sp. 47]QEL00159.1 biopolymer transporter ExbD [Olivibacter sp. LS-1]